MAKNKINAPETPVTGVRMKVLRVEDATGPLNYVVTSKHVEEGKRGEPDQCVVAQSLREVLPGLEDVEVGSVIVKVNILGTIYRYATPNYLRLALRHFDETGEWDLSLGVHTLNPPRGRDRLTKNQEGGMKDRWEKWKQEYDQRQANGTPSPKAGTGINQFKGRPLLTRRISITRVPKPETLAE